MGKDKKEGDFLPAVVARLLPQLLPWRTTDIGDRSLFEWVRQDFPHRWPVGKWYAHSSEFQLDNGLTGPEATALHEAGVFGAHSRSTTSGCAVHEHAEHAFADFLGDVTKAWEKYQSRLAEIPKPDSK